MKHPDDTFMDQRTPRMTTRRFSEKIGVSVRTVYKWFYLNANPRTVHIGTMARHLDCTHDEVRAMMHRSNAIIKAGYKLQYGQIIELDMLKQSHARILIGEHPFPEHNGSDVVYYR